MNSASNASIGYRWPGRATIGEDTRSILSRFEFAESEVERLLADGAIRA